MATKRLPWLTKEKIMKEMDAGKTLTAIAKQFKTTSSTISARLNGGWGKTKANRNTTTAKKKIAKIVKAKKVKPQSQPQQQVTSFDLTQPIVQVTSQNKTLFSCGAHGVILCPAELTTPEIRKKISKDLRTLSLQIAAIDNDLE